MRRAGKRPVAKRKNLTRVALGFRAHTGWAVLVAIGGTRTSPRFAHRRRIELGGPRVPRFVYHAAQEAGEEQARRIIRLGEATARKAATQTIRDAVAKLGSNGDRAVAAAVLTGTARIPADLRAILASHPLLHAAEGQLFRAALTSGCEACGLPVLQVPERELLGKTQEVLGLTPRALQVRLAVLGKIAGRPWSQDQKLAAVAAWLALASTD